MLILAVCQACYIPPISLDNESKKFHFTADVLHISFFDFNKSFSATDFLSEAESPLRSTIIYQSLH